ncbi:hypothetical protein SEE30663_16285, partial [Salmonella enterica subsp. enterica serovar Enteritidis str. SE30663]
TTWVFKAGEEAVALEAVIAFNPWPH